MNLSRLHKHLPKSSLLFLVALLIGLSFFSSWFFSAKPSVAQQRRSLEAYIQAQEADAEAVLADSLLLRRIINHTETTAEFQRLNKKKYGFFLFAETFSETHDLLFWNSQEIIPPPANFAPPDSVYFRHFLNGYYVVHKAKVSLPGISGNIMAYVLIPVLNKYYLETENSQTQFAHDKDAVRRMAISEAEATAFPVRSLHGTALFYVTKPAVSDRKPVDAVTLTLRLTALALLLVYLQLIVETVRARRGALTAVALLAVIVLLCRALLFSFRHFFRCVN